MPNPKREIDMDALNAITDQVLSYTPPPKPEEKKKRAEDEAKNPQLTKKEAWVSFCFH